MQGFSREVKRNPGQQSLFGYMQHATGL